jgi:type I restriction enzyme, R subunit
MSITEVWDVFRGVENTADEEALERHLSDEARRDEFYDRLNAFSRTMGIALSSHDFTNDPANQRRIEGYRNDLLRFENLRRTVRTRYQEAVNYGQYRRRIEKLLDTYIGADQVRPITELVNIFDEDAFDAALDSRETAASRADAIAHATKRTNEERWDEDPAFFKRFAELLREVIADFQAKRISDLEYLKRAREIRKQFVKRDTSDFPRTVRDDPLARAFFGTIQETLQGLGGNGAQRIEDVSADAAQRIVDIVKSHRRVDWASNLDVENAMKNDIDDYVFDVLRGGGTIFRSRQRLSRRVDRSPTYDRAQAGCVMVRTTTYGSAVIEYSLALSSRRSLSISVLPDGAVTVVAPEGVDLGDIDTRVKRVRDGYSGNRGVFRNFARGPRPGFS